MGSKNNPGVFDCYANAEPDEPMFVLLGRDKHAPLLVNLWAYMRNADGEAPAKVGEACLCADSMVMYRAHRKPQETPAGIRTALEALVAMAQDCGVVVTVEQVPLQPLAMGHYAHRVHCRPARESARFE